MYVASTFMSGYSKPGYCTLVEPTVPPLRLKFEILAMSFVKGFLPLLFSWNQHPSCLNAIINVTWTAE